MEQKNIKNPKNVENSVKLRTYFRSLPIEQSQEKAREMITDRLVYLLKERF